MTREEVYRGVRGAMALYGGLFKRLVEEVGLEEALSAHARLQEPYGDGWAELLKEELKGECMNIETFTDVYISTSTSGVENIYEAEPNMFRVLGHQCPIYDGLRDAGVDHDTIKLMCTSAGKLIIGALRKHYPMVEAGITFRDTPESNCVEWYRMRN